MSTSNDQNGEKRRRKRRWGDANAATATAAPAVASTATQIDSKAKALALQESIKARLEALKARTAVAAATPIAVPSTAAAAAAAAKPTEMIAPKRPASSVSSEPGVKRAKHYELDLSVTAPTFKQTPEPSKPKINPYLAHRKEENPEAQEEEDEEEEALDERVQASKVRKRGKMLHFVEPGTFTEIAERKRRKAANAVESGFVSGRKAGQYVSQQTLMTNIYGSTEVRDDDTLLANRPEANEKTSMPQVVEWWDMELLPNKLKKKVAAYEGKLIQQEQQSNMSHLLESKQVQRQLKVLQDPEATELQSMCFEKAALSYCKTAGLIQHIVPIKPPGAKDEPEAEPTLYLTKKERKRQRKLRRQEKLRELQDLQAAGLIPAPEARLTTSNFIRVLGDQAYLDPTLVEQKARAQMEARQRAHMERNEAAKLTKEQRAAKLARKLQEDTAKTGVHVALFYVKDLSHPYHRTKVDLNAQQANITGAVVECQRPQLACVICEGGPKAIKRYIRLMTVRMKWKGLDNDPDDEEEDGNEEGGNRPKFNPVNACELVWTGMATKRFFKGFVFQACESGMEAAKILRAKGVGHFWDQILAHASGKSDKFQLKLGDTDDEDSDEDDDEAVNVKEEDEAMEED